MLSGKKPKTNPSNTALWLPRIGIAFILIGVLLLAMTYGPIVMEELGFTIKHTVLKLEPKPIQPLDREFGIVIPKIEANAKVIPNVDPFDSNVYQRALTQGVAHAQGTGIPGAPGNVFIFSHSSSNFYDALRYNSIFYLLNKMEFGDRIEIFYKGEKYIYNVTSKRTVSKDAVQYLKATGDRQTLTLMTCWPPGTSINRLIVIAERTP